MTNQNFNIPAKAKTVSLVLMVIGALALIAGGIFLAGGGNDHDATRFWASLLQNSIFFLLICVASLFIMAATSLAQAAWIVSFRRIPEAIGSIVWVLGIIVFVVVGYQIIFDNHHIYPWLEEGHIPYENGRNGLKKFFLSKSFFLFWSALTIFLWGWLGKKMSSISLEMGKNKDKAVKLFWKNFNYSAAFLFVFAITLASTIPWLWLMSIDAHWFSTMFSWYTFASSFVSGMSMIMLWILYTKRHGNLELVTDEHVHDVGKFMFAFTIFWTYLWFSQFMLIWYANIPEETVYFKIRMHGPYSFFFWLNLVLNFVTPLLILMSAPAKRNYFVVSLVAIIILFGHWIDFYQIVMPGTVGEEWHFSWYEIGLACGFVGLVIFLVSRKLSTLPQIPENHPYLKETVIHVS
jgi:hypothetical protein